MLDHIGLRVTDYTRSREFYRTVLEPLGHGIVMEVTPDITGDGSSHAGFGRDGKPDFWIGDGKAGGGTHVAFAAQSRSAVDAFHQAALRAGATDNGAPGLRSQYHPDYYGAFVLDPDGYNIEAVCHAKEDEI